MLTQCDKRPLRKRPWVLIAISFKCLPFPKHFFLSTGSLFSGGQLSPQQLLSCRIPTLLAPFTRLSLSPDSPLSLAPRCFLAAGPRLQDCSSSHYSQGLSCSVTNGDMSSSWALELLEVIILRAVGSAASSVYCFVEANESAETRHPLNKVTAFLFA